MHTSSTSKRREAKTMKDSTRLAHLGSSSVATKHKYSKKRTARKPIYNNKNYKPTFPKRFAKRFYRQEGGCLFLADRHASLAEAVLELSLGPAFFSALLTVLRSRRSCTISIHSSRQDGSEHFCWWRQLVAASISFSSVFSCSRYPSCCFWSAHWAQSGTHYRIAVRKTSRSFRIVFTWTSIPPKFALSQGLIHFAAFVCFHETHSGASMQQKSMEQYVF